MFKRLIGGRIKKIIKIEKSFKKKKSEELKIKITQLELY